jgi:hypothetical protein
MHGLGGLAQRVASPAGCCIHTQLGWAPAAAAAAVAARHRRTIKMHAKRPQKVPTGVLQPLTYSVLVHDAELCSNCCTQAVVAVATAWVHAASKRSQGIVQ